MYISVRQFFSFFFSSNVNFILMKKLLNFFCLCFYLCLPEKKPQQCLNKGLLFNKTNTEFSSEKYQVTRNRNYIHADLGHCLGCCKLVVSVLYNRHSIWITTNGTLHFKVQAMFCMGFVMYSYIYTSVEFILCVPEPLRV